jgi:hypothetical protein
MKSRSRLVLSMIILLAAVITTGRVGRAAPAVTQGITITPVFQQVNIPEGADQQPINFSVTNNEKSTQTLSLSAADFNTLNETGGLLFVGANPTALQKKYGLAEWLALPQKQIVLQPGQTVQIKGSVLNLATLSAGGHYGALMLTSAGPGNSGPNNITLHPIASSLIFVTKLGGDTHRLGLSNVSLNRSLFHLPGSVTLRFHNDGNTHLTPRGTVTITNSSGKLISKGIINVDSGIILPETFRRYYVPLQSVSQANLPGSYVVKVDYRFDGINQFREYKQSFIYAPAGSIVLIASALIIIVFVLWRIREKVIVNK